MPLSITALRAQAKRVLLCTNPKAGAGGRGELAQSLARRLTEAGYQEVFASGENYDVNKTFAFFGDPLTAARVMPVDAIYLPKLTR